MGLGLILYWCYYSVLQCMAICSKLNCFFYFWKVHLKACSIHTEKILIKYCLPSHYWGKKNPPGKYWLLFMNDLCFYICDGLTPASSWASTQSLAYSLPTLSGMGKKIGRPGIRKLVGWNKVREITHQILLQPKQAWLEKFKLICGQ